MPRKAASSPPAGQAIRAAALRLFVEKGYAGASTREICALARITKPVLYYHFENKEQLYREILETAHAEAMQDFNRAAARAASASGKLAAVLAADFALTGREPQIARLLIRNLFAPPEETPAVDLLAFAFEWLRLIERIVRAGVRAREIRGNPRAIAEALMGIHLVYTMSFLLTGKPALGPALAKRIVHLVMEGCRA